MVRSAASPEDFYPAGSDATLQSIEGGTSEMASQLETIGGVLVSHETRLILLEQNSLSTAWPNLDNITFNEQALFGGQLPANPDSQVRAVLRGAIDAAAAKHNNNSDDILPTLDIDDPMPVHTRLSAVREHFKKARTIVGKGSKPIEYYVHFAEIRAELLHILEMKNHPLHQALSQVHVINARRKVEAAAGNSTAFLGRTELEQLEDNILKFCFAEDIIAFCDARILQLQREAKETRKRYKSPQ